MRTMKRLLGVSVIVGGRFFNWKQGSDCNQFARCNSTWIWHNCAKYAQGLERMHGELHGAAGLQM